MHLRPRLKSVPKDLAKTFKSSKARGGCQGYSGPHAAIARQIECAAWELGEEILADARGAKQRTAARHHRDRDRPGEPEPLKSRSQWSKSVFEKRVNHFSCGCVLSSCISEICEFINQGFVVADDDGRILFATERANRWFEEYFEEPQNLSLPGLVKAWLQRRNSKSFNCDRLAGGAREISIQRGSKRLTIQSLSPWQAKEHRLVLLESTDPLDPTPLEKLGLTRREAEVLFWAGQAKRNAEIGQILAMSERTVRTHMGKILAKLGVENRTAAANIAIEVLRLSAPTTSQKAPTHANSRE